MVAVNVVVLMVRVTVPEPVVEAGLKLAIAPAGKPLTGPKLIVPLNPFNAVTVIV